MAEYMTITAAWCHCLEMCCGTRGFTHHGFWATSANVNRVKKENKVLILLYKNSFDCMDPLKGLQGLTEPIDHTWRSAGLKHDGNEKSQQAQMHRRGRTQCVWEQRWSVGLCKIHKVPGDGIGKVGRKWEIGQGLLHCTKFRFCSLGQWFSILFPSATTHIA